jgi:hypothetical protein
MSVLEVGVNNVAEVQGQEGDAEEEANGEEAAKEGGGQVIAAERLEALRKSLDDAWDHSTELEAQIADGAEIELDRASVREIRGFVVAALVRMRETKA